MKTLTPLLLLITATSLVKAELQALDTEEMEQISGAGIGIVLRDVGIDAGQKASGSGQIHTRFSDYSALTVSELKITKAGSDSAPVNIGSTDDPISIDVIEHDNGQGNRDEFRLAVPDTADAMDIHLRLDYQAVDGFFEDTPATEKFLAEMDLKEAQVSDTTLTIWGEEDEGLALAFNTSLSVENLNISGTPDTAHNANIEGLSIRNLQFGNTYQPLTMKTTEDSTRTYDFGKGLPEPDPDDANTTHADDYNYVLNRLNNQEFDISRVEYIESVDGPTLTANVPRLEVEIAPLTEETAALKYAPYQGSNGAKAYSGTLTDIDIKSISFGNGVNLTPLAPESVALTRSNGDPVGTSWDYGQNVVEVRGLDIQHMRFTPRDIQQ